MDYSQGNRRKNKFAKDLRKKLVQTPLQFKEKHPLTFFGKDGWRVDENILYSMKLTESAVTFR